MRSVPTLPAGNAMGASECDARVGQSRRLARRIIRLLTNTACPATSSNPAGSPGGSFGYSLTRRALPLPQIPPARPADHSATHYRVPSHFFKSRRLARRLIRLLTNTACPPTSSNPAGSPGGSFGYSLTRRALPLLQIPPARPADCSGSDFYLRPTLARSRAIRGASPRDWGALAAAG